MNRETLLTHFESHPDKSWPLKELLSALRVHENKEKTVRRLLKGLVREGRLDREHGKSFRLSRAGWTVEGVARHSEVRGLEAGREVPHQVI